MKINPKLRPVLLPLIIMLVLVLLILMQHLLMPRLPKNSLASEKYRKGDFESATTIFQDLSKADPDDSLAAHNLAKSLYKRDKYPEAEKLLKDWEPKRKNSPSLLYDLGNTAFQNKQYAQAIEYYKRALINSPDDYDAKANLELAYRKLDEKQDKQNKPQDKPDPNDKQNKPKDNEDYRNILNALDQKEALDRQNKQGKSAPKNGKWW